MNKILVSACLMGQKVRYDGGHQRQHDDILAKWAKAGRIIPLCPEVSGGLPIPRPPAEIHPVSSKVVTNLQDDVTLAFTQGAQEALAMCHRHQIRFALMKESSPSCGSHYIYDGSFKGVKIPGQGITTRLLIAHGVRVYSENQLALLIKDVQAADKANSRL